VTEIEPGQNARKTSSGGLPGLVFTVAITGHQDIPTARHTDLQNKIAEILAAAAKSLIEEQARPELDKNRELDLRFVSALAPGADQIGARAAEQVAGWKLSAILPFPRKTFEALARATLEERDAEKRMATPKRASLGAKEIDKAVEQIGTLAEGTHRVLELADWQPGGDARLDRDWQTRRYATIGQMLVRRADLLIALWDGKPPRGRGGTADVVTEARRSGVPVIWIDPETNAVRSLLPGAHFAGQPESGAAGAMDHAVRQVMLGFDPGRATSIALYQDEPAAQTFVACHAPGKDPPDPVPGDTFGAYSRMLYWALRHPREHLLTLTDEEVVAGKRWKPLRSYPFRLAREPGRWFDRKALLYPFSFGVDPGAPGTANAAPLLHHAARADALATRLGNQYRSAYVRIFALAPVAVMCAVISALLLKLSPDVKHYLVMAELFTVGFAAWIYLKTRADDPVAHPPKRPGLLRRIFPRSQDTHQRWLDARLIAESQRSGQLLAWVGFSGRRPIEEPEEEEHPHEPQFGQNGVPLRQRSGHAAPRTVWAPHYANAIAALPELPGNKASGDGHGVLTPGRIVQIAEAAGAVIADQRDYHKLNHRRLETLNHRLDTFSLRAIQVAAAVSVLYLVMWALIEVPGYMHWSKLIAEHSSLYVFYKYFLTYAAAFGGAVLPAVAAAAAGIRFQGDFERFAMRSKDTAARLKVLAERAKRIAERARACGEVACAGQPPLFEPLLDLLLDTQAVLDEDLADWRFAYAARPITLG
jgi:hypothetical protein